MKIKFPCTVDTNYETATILSRDDLKSRISALERIKTTTPMDWEKEDMAMLEELELLEHMCHIYDYEDSSSK